MNQAATILIGRSTKPERLLLPLANRHGLIAGATGTGKTVSLQVLAEGFSSHGVPVFLADAKGDLSGLSQAGGGNPKLEQRARSVGLTYSPRGFPTVYWDLFGEKGHPIRTTVSEMGPLLLSRLLELNDTQEGVLNVAFRVADDQGLLLLDLKDLQAMLKFVGDSAKELTTEYGHVSKASVGAIQRRLLVLEEQGGEHLFGEPALELSDLMQRNSAGHGCINILAAEKLMHHPRLYATFLLWLLAELFEELPEVGDQPKPRLVFFFDEAHLLFKGAPPALITKVEQVVRLIRSKSVGIYFVSQNPLDIPDTVLGQLGNRVQHALRAFTPRARKAVRAAAETFRENPAFDTAQVVTELGVGEALVSTLEGQGIPSVVQRTLISPPASRLGPATPSERDMTIRQSPLMGRYDQPIDRASAYEHLRSRAAQVIDDATLPTPRRYERPEATQRTRRRQRQTPVETLVKGIARSVGSTLGRQLVRGLLGSLFKGR